MAQSLASLVGATWVNSQYYGGDFSVAGAFALNGPLGASIGALGGMIAGFAVMGEILKKDPNDTVLATAAAGGLILAGPVIAVVAFGGEWTQAIAMSVGSAVATQVLCIAVPSACTPTSFYSTGV